MTMSETEICNDYKAALDKQKQRVVLADLNVCSKREIDEILQKHGLLEPAKRGKPGNKKIDDEIAFELHRGGKTDKEIAAVFGACEAAAASWRERNGLSKNPVPKKGKKPVLKQDPECKKADARKTGKGVTVEIYFPDGVVPCQIRILGGTHGEL